MKKEKTLLKLVKAHLLGKRQKKQDLQELCQIYKDNDLHLLSKDEIREICQLVKSKRYSSEQKLTGKDPFSGKDIVAPSEREAILAIPAQDLAFALQLGKKFYPEEERQAERHDATIYFATLGGSYIQEHIKNPTPESYIRTQRLRISKEPDASLAKVHERSLKVIKSRIAIDPLTLKMESHELGNVRMRLISNSIKKAWELFPEGAEIAKRAAVYLATHPKMIRELNRLKDKRTDARTYLETLIGKK